MLVLAVLLAVVSLALAGMVAWFIMLKRKASPPVDALVQHVVTPDKPSGPLVAEVKDSLKDAAVADPSRWTYSSILRISRFEQEAYPIILLARGKADRPLYDQQMLVLLSAQNNDLYIGFRRAVPMPTPDVTMFNISMAAQQMISTMSQYFCFSRVENAPFFRYFTLDVTFDYNNSYAKVYLDGELVRAMNLADCGQVLAKHDGGQLIAGYYALAPDMVCQRASLQPWPVVDYRHIALHNLLLSPTDIQSGAVKSLAGIHKLMAKELSAKDTKKSACSI
ncbi:hypothetical protein HXX76_014177 [Chlamydomonas incerta]|uniref:Uncharacterized protein n=1 Tax=Chlamydomonas incerta TaxID=51695 RepID=A0A835SDL9_CHLIN|nr:hypothetical protein HXX76_014177 [Chlamydomonas incerta]|eukprot:KAG2425019.1 hypothetical protein HXX76_014177 [Chlamydomonas incerta]